MKKALYLLIAFSIPVAIFLIGGLFLSGDYQFEEQVSIEAPPEKVFDQLNNLENWATWSAWSYRFNPKIQVEYYGPPAGNGAGLKFIHKKGTGNMEITESIPVQEVQLEMRFGGAEPVHHEIEVSKNGSKTLVTWKTFGNMDYGIASGWLAMITPRNIRSQVKVSLNQLKIELEKPANDQPDGN
jgi:carbon monoxide dehydrogenase subunit G